ncbi:MAG: DUF3050 domain-containing protein [Tatlockia sp.]|nr:DUF3050 domain-containing protein [Tatlockia sp.]
MTNYINHLNKKLRPLTLEVANHEVYNHITSLNNLRLFMEQHVFAVWDFMCLLKELHRNLVSTSSPWFPPKDALSANLINSILTEEESDLAEDGKSYLSHYEIYINAMEEIGANTDSINEMLKLLKTGHTIEDALSLISIRLSTKEFILTTFSFFKLDVHELASAFVFGREGVTSAMFLPLLKQLENKLEHSDKHQLNTLTYYFKRHIDLDDNEHFPKALKMLANMIGNDSNKRDAIEEVAKIALKARINFLTGIQKSFSESK